MDKNDRNQVLGGLEICLKGLCDICLYNHLAEDNTNDCRDQLMQDALSLLKKQEPHILAPDKFGDCGIGWIEYWFGEKHPKVYFEQCVWAGSRVMTYNIMFSLEPRSVKYKYGKLCGFRIWAGDFAPSKKIRKAVLWDD